MKKLLDIYLKFGWLGILAFVIPVYWTQDTQLKHNGYDILSLCRGKHSYSHGTWQSEKRYWRKKETR